VTSLADRLRANRAKRHHRRTLLVLLAIEAFEPATALDVERLTALPFENLYKPLAELEIAGHVTGEWETSYQRPDGIPRRRYYSVTDSGRRRVAELVTLLRTAPKGDE
jgi:hypothetical protein